MVIAKYQATILSSGTSSIRITRCPYERVKWIATAQVCPSYFFLTVTSNILICSISPSGISFYTLLLLSSDATAVYAFGSNKRGQLGIQTNNHDRGKDMWCVLCPQKLNSLHGIVSVSANGDHSAALTGG